MAKLGQHFLADKKSLEKIAALLGVKNGEVVFEIGAGHGELTEEIIRQFGSSAIDDFKIIAIEKDSELAGEFQKKFSEDERIEIIRGDALKLLPAAIRDSATGRSYKIAGNIPYYITGKLLRIIGDLPAKPSKTVLTIQKEVAERLAAEPPNMNRLAASVQFWAKPEIAFILPKNYFNPPPEVDSATIVLKPAPAGKTPVDAYYKIVRAVFAQPRKTILNNLSDNLGIAKKEIGEKLRKACLDENLRPQNLTLENIFELASIF